MAERVRTTQNCRVCDRETDARPQSSAHLPTGLDTVGSP
jgi:hypothetical protein